MSKVDTFAGSTIPNFVLKSLSLTMPHDKAEVTPRQWEQYDLPV
jgi:hypothetical protein